MASIRARKNKDGLITSYQIRVFRGKTRSGKQKKPFERTWPDKEKGETIPKGWSKDKIEKEVAKIAALFEKECSKGTVCVDKKKFSEYAAYTIALKERTKKIKHKTAVRYQSFLNFILTLDDASIADIHIDKIRPNHLNDLYEVLSADGLNKNTGGRLSDKTVLEYHRFISSVLSQAVKEGILFDNVARRATPPSPEQTEAEGFEIEEIFDIMKDLERESLKWKVLTHMLITSGGRRGEILGIKWSVVDFYRNVIKFCNNILYTPDRGIYEDTLKNHRNRYVAFPVEVMEMLKRLRIEQLKERMKAGDKWKDTGLVFTNRFGGPMHPDSVTDWFSKFQKKREKQYHINPHKFRHSQYGLLINSDVDIATISKRLGHQKISTTTNFYSHVLKNSDDKASQKMSNVLYQR